MSLVNESLKFQMAILQRHCYFFVEKMIESFAFQQKITVYLLLKLICIKQIEGLMTALS